MAPNRPPEQTIRDWLESNGPARVGIGAIEQTWGISPLDAADRRRIAAALESAGVLCEPPLTRAGRGERLRLSVVEVAEDAPAAEEAPATEEDPAVEEEPPAEEDPGAEDAAAATDPEPPAAQEPPAAEASDPPFAPSQPQPATRRGRPRSPRRLLDRQRARRASAPPPVSPPPRPEPAPPEPPEAEPEPPQPEFEPEPFEPEPVEPEPVESEPEPAPPEPEPDYAPPEPEPEPEPEQPEPDYAEPEPEPPAFEDEPEPAPEPEPALEPEPEPETPRQRNREARRRRRAERARREERSPDPKPPLEPAFEPEPELPFEPEPDPEPATAVAPAATETDPPEAAAQDAPASPRNRLLPFAAALLAMAVGSVAPWSKAVFTVDSGFDRSGALILVIAVLAAVTVALAVRENARSWLPYLAAALGALAIAITAGNFRDIVDDTFVGPAWGLYLSFVGASALVVLSMFLTVKRD